MAENKESQPPQPPHINRRFLLYPHQYITIPLIFLIPILALFGVFGDKDATAQQSNENVSVEVEYTSRSRYRMPETMTVLITPQQSMETLTARFDRDYMDAFSEVAFMPDVQIVTEDAYFVELTNVEAGQTYVISVDLKAEFYGQHSGTVTVEGAEIPVEIFVFP